MILIGPGDERSRFVELLCSWRYRERAGSLAQVHSPGTEDSVPVVSWRPGPKDQWNGIENVEVAITRKPPPPPTYRNAPQTQPSL